MTTKPKTKEEKCNCEEMTCKENCKSGHTHKVFWCPKCHPEKYQRQEVKEETYDVPSENDTTFRIGGTNPPQESLREWEKEFEDGAFRMYHTKIKKYIIPFIRELLLSHRTKEYQELIKEIKGLKIEYKSADNYRHGSNDAIDSALQVITSKLK